MKYVKIKVDFYADTFRSCTFEVPEKMFILSDLERRRIVTNWICKEMNKTHPIPYGWNNRPIEPTEKHIGRNCFEGGNIIIFTAKILHEENTTKN